MRKDLEEALSKLEGAKHQSATADDSIKTEIKEESLIDSGNIVLVVGSSEDGMSNIKEEAVGTTVKAEEDHDDELLKDQKENAKAEKFSPSGAGSNFEKKDVSGGGGIVGTTATGNASGTNTGSGAVIKSEKELKDAIQKQKEIKIAESELVRDLKAQLK